MKVLVIGCGLIGITTAYFLRRRGYEVTVIDRRGGPGQETSFANGALLTPSMPEPWNAPGCWRVLMTSLGRGDAPLQVRWCALPSLLGWGASFLKNSNTAAFERSTLSNLRLALYSLEVMQSLRQQVQIAYGRGTLGTLRVFRGEPSLEAAVDGANRLALEGLRFRRLSREETVGLEPALEPIANELAGALHYVSDETGDAHRFCVSLADRAREQGVDFQFSSDAISLEMKAGRVVAVRCAREDLVADKYIVAAGSYSTELLRRVGVRVPVRPAKGYSVTFDYDTSRGSLKIPVIDDQLHAGIVPLEGAIRVVGTAEFAGFDRTINPGRIRNLLKLLQGVLPREQFDPSAGRPWCGLRPMSVDGVPIIGTTFVPNLLVNTGHGHLGWTMAAGSGQLLADIMSGDTPSIDPAPFALERFT